jgi:hypothetical protein
MIWKVDAIIVLAAVCGVLLAGEPAEDPAEEPADLELIEFLGSFTTDDGEWVDPLGMLGDDMYLDAARDPEGLEDDDDKQID